MDDGPAFNQVLQVQDEQSLIVPQSISFLDMHWHVVCGAVHTRRLKEVPGSILRDCSSLSVISLHQNPINLEMLRQSPGFDAYDARRRARSDKQVRLHELLHTKNSQS